MRIFTVFGIVVILIGALLLIYSSGITSAGKLSVITERGKIGIELHTTKVYELSLVSPGATYAWELEAKNTGTIDWSNSWVTVRVGTDGSIVVDKTEEGIIGSFKVEKCQYGTDVEQCREDLGISGWNLQYHNGKCGSQSSWLTPTCNKNVCSIPFGELKSGSSKSACFKLTIPNDAKGNYPLITNLMAYVSGYYAVASKVDSITIGSIPIPQLQPEWYKIIGMVLIPLGTVLTVFGIKKKW